MVGKRGISKIAVVVIILIIIGGILFYNFSKDKSTEEGLVSTSDEEIAGDVSLTEEETGIIPTIIDFIKEFIFF